MRPWVSSLILKGRIPWRCSGRPPLVGYPRPGTLHAKSAIQPRSGRAKKGPGEFSLISECYWILFSWFIPNAILLFIQFYAFSDKKGHNSQHPPSTTAPFLHVTHPVSGAQPVEWILPGAGQPYKLQHYPPKPRISSKLHENHSLHFPGPDSAAAQTAAFHLQHPHLSQQPLQFAERESLEPRSLSLSEGALHGTQTEGSLLSRNSQGKSLAGQYTGQRMTIDVRSDYQHVRLLDSLPLDLTCTAIS